MGGLALSFFWSFYAGLGFWIYTDQFENSIVSKDFYPKPYWFWIPVCAPAKLSAHCKSRAPYGVALPCSAHVSVCL